MMPHSRVTLKVVAAKAGVHPTTVSMALRNHPQLPEETRLRLQKLAQEMGYQPDPVLGALNAYRLEQHRRSFQGVIAWVDPVPMSIGPRRLSGYAPYWDSAAARCQELGFSLEEFRLKARGMTGARLSRILRERGINGVIVAPLHAARGHINMRWEWFSAVSTSYSLSSPQLHTFVPAQYSTMMDAIRRLRRLGYKRPGFVTNSNEHERTDRLRVAAYLVGMNDYRLVNAPPPLIQKSPDPEAFHKWLDKYRPDVVIGQHLIVPEWIIKTGRTIPEDIGFAGVAVPADGTFSGVVEGLHLLGSTAVTWLDSMIRRGERGVPEQALRVLIPGSWNAGTTLKSLPT